MYRGGSVTVIVVPWTINIKKDKNKLGYNTSALGNQYVEVGWTARTRRTCPFCHVLFIRFFVVVLSACFLSQDTSLVQKKKKQKGLWHSPNTIQWNKPGIIFYTFHTFHTDINHLLPSNTSLLLYWTVRKRNCTRLRPRDDCSENLTRLRWVQLSIIVVARCIINSADPGTF